MENDYVCASLLTLSQMLAKHNFAFAGNLLALTALLKSIFGSFFDQCSVTTTNRQATFWAWWLDNCLLWRED